MSEMQRKGRSARKFTQRRIIASIHGFLSRLSRPLLALLIIGLVFAIGAVDYITGFDLSVSLFYLAPITISAWYINRSTALGVSIACAVMWFVTSVLTLPVEEFPIVVLLWNAGVRLGFFVVVTALLIALHHAIDRERALARTDYLTGVKNSRSFYEQADIEFRRAQRHHWPLSIVYIDVDDFKELNDRFGHNEGDNALRAIGTALLRYLRAIDVVGRMGGDEFAILLPEAGRSEAISIVKRLHKLLTTELRGSGWPITLSIGAVTCAPAPTEITHVMKEVDALMYEVKRSGKNRVKHKIVNCEE
ncbi:MAG: diguanylate cyclase [Deltaproteobacteria bacterium]|nr:diguanylate cyclase [Deltaproteobacteria bacterium]